MRRTLSVSSLLFVLAISDVLAQVPTGVSNTFEVPEAAPLRPPKPYNPSLTPRVDFLVVASLPGNVPCSDLSADDLNNLERAYCRNIGVIANLSSAWFAETCEASCAPSRRRLLQVNPIIFDVECVRATENPEDVPQANREAMELEQEALVNDLLGNSLEATLPGASVVAENITSTFVGEEATPGPEEVIASTVPQEALPSTPGAQQAGRPSAPGAPELGEAPTSYQVQYPEKQKDENESCFVDGAWYQHGLFVYCKDCVYNYCRCCNGVWKQCTNALTGSEAPSC